MLQKQSVIVCVQFDYYMIITSSHGDLPISELWRISILQILIGTSEKLKKSFPPHSNKINLTSHKCNLKEDSVPGLCSAVSCYHLAEVYFHHIIILFKQNISNKVKPMKINKSRYPYPVCVRAHVRTCIHVSSLVYSTHSCVSVFDTTILFEVVVSLQYGNMKPLLTPSVLAA